jgi:hypothetical protein
MKYTLSPKNDHDMYRLDLPWFANGTLDEQSTLLLKNHLADCDSCRDELVNLTAMQKAIADSPIADSDTQASFERMQKRINNDSRDTGVSIVAKISGLLQQIINGVPAPQWALASICGLLIGFLILQVGGWPPTEENADYHVLSSGESTDNLTIYAKIDGTLSQSESEKLLHELTRSVGFEMHWKMTGSSEFRATIAQNESPGVLLPEKLSEILNNLRQSSLIGEAGIAPEPQ